MPQTSKDNFLRFLPLGGLEGVTKNMYSYEHGGDIVLVDCGIGFPEETMLGVDVVIPDVTPLLNKLHKIRGIILTHGHEDHIGALPYLLPKLKFPPVFATRLTAGLVEVKLREFGLHKKADLRVLNPDESFNLGVFKLSFFRLSHSIPDAVGVALGTPVGVVIHASDFKFDWTPVSGSATDVGRIARLGASGVLLLASDCLRVEKGGHTLSESFIEETFLRHMRETSGRIFVTMFSSSIGRIQQAVNASSNSGRRVALVGRSFEDNVAVARRLGFLHLPRGILVDPEEIKKIADQNLTLIVAGSQGQPNSALSRIANRAHRLIKVKKGDTVLFSSDPIPGSEGRIEAVINALVKQGAEVFYSAITDELHVSGHGSAEDLKLMIALTKPKFLVPIGGTPVLARQYSLLAQSMGCAPEKIFELEDGQTLELGPGAARRGRKVGLKQVMVDGLGVGDIGEIVLRDREVLAKDGILVVIAPIDVKSGKVSGEIEIVSRGFVYVKESQDLMNKVKGQVRRILEESKSRPPDFFFLRDRIERELEKFLYHRTHRRPLILTVLIKV